MVFMKNQKWQAHVTNSTDLVMAILVLKLNTSGKDYSAEMDGTTMGNYFCLVQSR